MPSREHIAGDAGDAGEAGEAGEAGDAASATDEISTGTKTAAVLGTRLRDRPDSGDLIQASTLHFTQVMDKVCRLEDLVAWQLAVQLRQLTHRYCARPAIQRDFRFCNNLVDAASSAPRNIAEGYGRKYHREFARFAIIARGSEREVLECLTEAHERRFISAAEFDAGDHAARKALKVLNALIAYLEATPDWGRD